MLFGMKCSICKNEISTIFLGKILGTYIKDRTGKRRAVCKECQRNNNIESIKSRL